MVATIGAAHVPMKVLYLWIEDERVHENAIYPIASTLHRYGQERARRISCVRWKIHSGRIFQELYYRGALTFSLLERRQRDGFKCSIRLKVRLRAA
jgi:hypothetical protein